MPNIAPVVTLLVVGSCLKIAPQEGLGRWKAARENVLARLLRRQAEGSLAGAVLIDTCNRFEILADVPAATDAAAFADAVLADLPDLPRLQFTGEAAVEHTVRVTSGLESMVVGEEQIQGQVSRAFAEAAEVGLLSRRLHMLWTRLLHAARNLRARRPHALVPRSVAELAARIARDAGPSVAVVGAGDTGRLVAEELHRLGTAELFVFNRTLARAEHLAAHCGATALGLDVLQTAPPAFDVMVLAIDGGAVSVPHRDMPRLRAVIDISQPSALDPSLRERDDLLVLDLDALQLRAEAAGSALDAWAEETGVLAAGHAHRIWGELCGDQSCLGRLVELHVENAMSEIDRACRGRLRGLEQRVLDEVRALVERVARRNAHLHVKDLRQLLVS